LLHGTQPRGPQFTKTVLDILQRENNWILWKRENCKGFERSPATSNQSTPLVPKKASSNAGVKKIKMGNAELSRLWNLSQDNHEVLVQSSHTPDLDKFLAPVLEDKPTLLKDDKIYAWKALRLIARTRFRYFSELSEKKLGSMEELTAIIERDIKGSSSQPTTSENGNGIRSIEISAEIKKEDLDVAMEANGESEDKEEVNGNNNNEDNENNNEGKHSRTKEDGEKEEDGVVPPSKKLKMEDESVV